MEILRWQALNPLANYQYIVCDSVQNAVLIDPLDTAEITSLIRRFSLKVKAIFITHEHPDHSGEAGPLQEKFQVPVYSSHPCAATVTSARIDGISDKAELRLSKELNFRFHYTPGHTPGHAVIEADGLLFTGDCLFHAGCGHCRSAGASVEEHYTSLHTRLATLNPDLLLFPGHYYARRNLEFALHVEPDNRRAHDLRQRCNDDRDEMNHQTTLRQEREYNPFLRTESRSLRRRVGELTGKDLNQASALQVFSELRRLRDNW
ncbi:MAG: hydroxyacylglutathione hydrolase C-terminal domain-containing protein [Spirochaetota bacterium]